MAITENQCIVDSTYLTPTEYSHAIQTELRLDVYNILNVGTSIRIAPTLKEDVPSVLNNSFTLSMNFLVTNTSLF